MSWRSILVAVAVVTSVSCGERGDADDSNNQPDVTVLGTTVDTGQPKPTIGSAVSTERD